jgi:hypothetical protein
MQKFDRNLLQLVWLTQHEVGQRGQDARTANDDAITAVRGSGRDGLEW